MKMISERKISESLSISQFEINGVILHFRFNRNLSLERTSEDVRYSSNIAGINSFQTDLKTIFIESFINPLLRNVVKWSDTMVSICCKIFKVCLTILRHCEVKG